MLVKKRRQFTSELIFPLLCWIATVLGGHFGKCYYSPNTVAMCTVSTVLIQYSSEKLSTEESRLLFSTVCSIPARQNWLYFALVAPFMGLDGPCLCCTLCGVSPRWLFAALRQSRDSAGSSIAKSFLLYYIMLAVLEYDEGYMVHQTIAT